MSKRVVRVRRRTTPEEAAAVIAGEANDILERGRKQDEAAKAAVKRAETEAMAERAASYRASKNKQQNTLGAIIRLASKLQNASDEDLADVESEIVEAEDALKRAQGSIDQWAREAEQ